LRHFVYRNEFVAVYKSASCAVGEDIEQTVECVLLLPASVRLPKLAVQRLSGRQGLLSAREQGVIKDNNDSVKSGLTD
jgi:hypothetical protein